MIKLLQTFEIILIKIGECFERFENSNKQRAALIYALVSSLFFVLVSIFIKFLHGVGSSQILYFRSLISLVLNSILISTYKIEPYAQNQSIHKLLMMRCVFAGIGHYCFYQAMYILDVSDAIIIFQTSPFWTAVLAGLILNEKLSKYLFLTLICSFTGILLVIQPNFIREILGSNQLISTKDQGNRMIGFIYGTIYSSLVSVAMVLIKKIIGGVHNSIVIHYALISGVIISGLDMIQKGEFSNDIFIPTNMFYMLLVALFNYSAQILYSRAMVFEKASTLAPLLYSQVVFGFIIETTVFQKDISLYSVFGASLIILGNLQSFSGK